MQPANDQMTTIDDLVVGSFTQSRDVLMDIFQTKDIEVVAKWAKVASALRMMNDDAIERLGRVIIVRIFDEIGKDPTDADDREFALHFVDNIALALQDAVQIMMGQAQQRMAAQNALAQGRGGLLKG